MSRLRWFRPSYLLVLAVLLFVAVALVGLPLLKLATYPLVSNYREGTCTITSKALQEFGGSEADPTYLAHFEYTVRTANGAQAHGNRYDWFDGAGWLGGPFEVGSTDRAGEQDVLNRYAVGQAYRCWYDAGNPSQAVLTRDEDWFRLLNANPLFALVTIVVGLIVLAFVLIIVAGLARLSWQAMRGEPAPVRSHDERRERARQSLEQLQRTISRREPPK